MKILLLFALLSLCLPALALAGDIPAPPDVAAPPEDAEVTASGLASKVLKAGTGKEHPTASSTVSRMFLSIRPLYFAKSARYVATRSACSTRHSRAPRPSTSAATTAGIPPTIA